MGRYSMRIRIFLAGVKENLKLRTGQPSRFCEESRRSPSSRVIAVIGNPRTNKVCRDGLLISTAFGGQPITAMSAMTRDDGDKCYFLPAGTLPCAAVAACFCSGVGA